MNLSIIVPVYNTNIDEIKNCIYSIVKSNNFNSVKYEILLIDDGSLKSNSLKYKKLADKIENVKYVKKGNGGVSSARNKGIDIAKGKYIVFVDSDDILISENIDWDLLNDKYDIVFYNLSIMRNNSIIKNHKEVSFKYDGEINYIDILKDYIYNNKFYSPCAKFIKRDFLVNNSIKFNENMINGEDAIFNLDMLLRKPTVFYVDKSIYSYNYAESHYEDRVVKSFDMILHNYLYKYNRKKKVISRYHFDDKYIKRIENDAIKRLFSIGMICLNNKNDMLHEITKYMDEFCIKDSDLSFSNKIKYHILKNNNIIMLKFFTFIRKIKKG